MKRTTKLSTAFLFSFTIISLLGSCKKTDEPEPPLPTHYKGVLVDFATRMPIANNKVYLITWASERLDDNKLWNYLYADTSLVLPNTPKGTVDSAITAMDGTFSFLYPPQVAPKDFLNFY